ncbi:growth hormone receptor-like isoform X1 [Xiphophorus maculatus]|uniref:growth hormone receptor-like isoform X1 n=1 Tax=Xiphophorus maculatus TaxID=8083 RepID=UPI000293A9D6|nr:growth hormone receptor-like isoform X1 [Xiphophorus maculatus]XP_023185314.1 growth hormone receptor-like isoform X1 [Xiphophorus maculatus]XP_023185315.1 growth hormone receptor-like isoform X1 [Xiphophorus maculatus]XP_023185316.1 growth hormone receptor-like isoform X1 [Xiphophorus maculatus]
MMLWLLFFLLPLGGSSSEEGAHKAKLDNADPGAPGTSATSRPQIYYCRSPNMEDFTCWWRPVDQQAVYVLTYSKDTGPQLECPDYTSGGLHSCYFDKSHTSIWKYYCMTVTAMTPHRNYTSQQHCLDVAEIVETEAPVNLSSSLRDAGGDEAGHSALLSWTYPAPEDLRYGWITLVYELQYRRIGEDDNWKAKHPLREAHVELLGLRPGDYVVRVRCRSHNSRLWSKWSAALLVSVPNRPPAGKVLVLVLVVGVGAVALLVVAFGVIPQSRRIKDYFLPPIPKPRIMGIDPLLLKKGNFDEINRHFSNFHGYRPPGYSVELWDQVSADGIYLSAPRDCGVLDRDRGTAVAIQNMFPVQNSSLYVRGAPPYCAVPPEAFAALQDAPSPWQQPEAAFVSGSDYSTMERLGVPDASVSAPDPARAPVQDFYTCVQLMRDSGEVHLVPCLPAPYCQDFLLPPVPDAAKREEEEKKSKRLAEYQARKNATKDDGDDRSDAADPLLPVSPDDTS